MTRPPLPSAAGAVNGDHGTGGIPEVIALLIVSAPLIAFVAYGLFVQPTH